MIRPEFTGRKRHRVHKPFLGKSVLVLQYEVRGFVPEYIGGHTDGDIRTWFVDARPEWEMTEGGPE